MYEEFEASNDLSLTDIICWVGSIVIAQAFQVILMYVLYFKAQGLTDLVVAFDKLTLIYISEDDVEKMSKKNKRVDGLLPICLVRFRN